MGEDTRNQIKSLSQYSHNIFKPKATAPHSRSTSEIFFASDDSKVTQQQRLGKRPLQLPRSYTTEPTALFQGFGGGFGIFSPPPPPVGVKRVENSLFDPLKLKASFGGKYPQLALEPSTGFY
jgi:hypothetical protein